MNQNIGIIKIGKSTQNHERNLKALGYTVDVVGNELHVQVEGFVDALDLSAGRKPLQDLIRERKALGYKTRVTREDGRVVFGVPACVYLQDLSCLMMAPPRKEHRPRFAIDDFAVAESSSKEDPQTEEPRTSKSHFQEPWTTLTMMRDLEEAQRTAEELRGEVSALRAEVNALRAPKPRKKAIRARKEA